MSKRMTSNQKSQDRNNEYNLEKQERYQEHDNNKKKDFSKQRAIKQKQKWND